MTPIQNFEGLAELVRQWSIARRIIPNSNPLAQARKALEECGELIEATTQYPYTGDKAPIVDAIGDVMVCLINCAELADLEPVECLSHAYDQIKHRRGYLRADGVFVKEAQE